MKKDVIIVSLLSLSVLFGIYMYGINPDIEHVRIDYGNSKIYTKADIDEAVNTIKEDYISKNSGIALTEVTYKGDEDLKTFLNDESKASFSGDDLKNDRKNYSACMTFDVKIKTNSHCDGAWIENTEYDNCVAVVRDKKGDWKLYGIGSNEF